MTTEFDLADKEFIETRTKNRVEAITRARSKLKRLEREVKIVKADIAKAETGNFITLVEKYMSTLAAEEFE